MAILARRLGYESGDPSRPSVRRRRRVVTFPGQDSAEVFFLDDDRACTPMRIPKGLVDLLVLVGDGTITHLGQGM
jgi:hypothetical protein